MRLRNKGGSWRRSNGSLVLRNEVFEPNVQEFARLEIRQLIGSRFEIIEERIEITAAGREALRTDEPAPETEPAAVTEAAETETTTASAETTEVQVASWPLKMAPDVYLKLHPEGQHAALARQYVTPEE